MVVAEAIDAVLAVEIGLMLTNFRKAQLVINEVCREMGLVVDGKSGVARATVRYSVKPGPTTHHFLGSDGIRGGGRQETWA